MAVNPLKIRLGAADSMILQMGGGTGTQYDLGASQGGCMFNFNATVLQVEIDQSIMPLQAFRTKEEISFTTTLLQIQMNLVNLAFGYGGTASGVTTTATGTLGTPATPTLLVVGTAGAVTYTYKVVGFASNGDSLPSTAATTAVGPTTLSATNYITITHAGGLTGAVGYKIERTAGGVGAGIIGTVYGNGAFTFNDTGLAATAYTDLVTATTYPNADTISVGGLGGIPSGVFTASMPKQDQTSNKLRLSMFKVVSAKPIKIDWARDKISSLSGFELLGLADTSRATGVQGFSLTEEY